MIATDFGVTITDPERAKDFAAVFGRTTVPVTSFFPTRANLPGKPGALIFLLDLARLTPDERARLIAHLAQRFGLAPADVAQDLDAQGVPILADSCIGPVADLRQLL